MHGEKKISNFIPAAAEQKTSNRHAPRPEMQNGQNEAHYS